MSMFTQFSDPPEVTHFYSYATGISIELPKGFEQENEGDAFATYAERGAEPVRVQARVVGRIESVDPAAAVRALADGFAAQGETIQRRDLVVDQLPASTVVTRSADGRLLHQTAIADDGGLLTVVAVLPSGTRKSALAKLDAAIESIRVIAP